MCKIGTGAKKADFPYYAYGLYCVVISLAVWIRETSDLLIENILELDFAPLDLISL
jgi:hypothetical protein